LHCNWQLYVIHVILLSCWQLLLYMYQIILSRAGHYLRFYQDMAISQLEKNGFVTEYFYARPIFTVWCANVDAVYN